MKMKLFYDEFDLFDIEVQEKLTGLSYVLTDNCHAQAVKTLLDMMEEVRESKQMWSRSFDKSYVEISSGKVRCGELYNEESYVDLKHSEFKKILNQSESFFSKKGTNRETFITFVADSFR